MPSSAHASRGSATSADALHASALTPRSAGLSVHFEVVSFRRDATGAVVPAATVVVPNGDIAWRRARAEAFEHDIVGAVALTGSDRIDAGRFADGVLLAQFGEVALDALS